MVEPAPQPEPADRRPVAIGIYVVFCASGFAALLYQIVWQRALFTIYGIDTESVTMVVTAFMLGLGLGSLVGGGLSRSPRRPVLLYFALFELSIGAFGAGSLALFRRVGAATVLLPSWTIGLTTFTVVLVPTLLMGATLPLLVAHAVAASHNVGRSVGRLYFVNTLGSALAALAAVAFLLGTLGQQGTVLLAACINAAVGVAVLVIHLRRRRA